MNAPKYTLHFHPMSGCSRRVVTFAAVNKVPLELQPVALEKGEQKSAPFLKMNPAGRVPVLEIPAGEDGPFYLPESAAILRFLAKEYAPETLGATPVEGAAVDRWLFWGASHLASASGALNAETGLKRMFGGTPDPETVKKLTAELTAQLAVLEAALATDFVAGDKPTLADFYLAATLESGKALSGYDPAAELPDVALPKVAAWYTRVISLDGYPS